MLEWLWASVSLGHLSVRFKSWMPDSVFSLGDGRSSLVAWYFTAFDIEEALSGVAASMFTLPSLMWQRPLALCIGGGGRRVLSLVLVRFGLLYSWSLVDASNYPVAWRTLRLEMVISHNEST